jgi:hypothetical protein
MSGVETPPARFMRRRKQKENAGPTCVPTESC